jgi:hypothetical protein
MPGTRLEGLVARIQKGARKTQEFFGSLQPEEWTCLVYPGPQPWTVREVLAHFLSSEKELLRLVQDVAAGGPGAPEGFDFDAFNALERERLANQAPDRLLTDLAEARGATLAWLRALPEDCLDRVGRHPALGMVSVETMVTAIYGHQLLHVRDIQRALE